MRAVVLAEGQAQVAGLQTVSSLHASSDPHALFLLLNLAVAQVFYSDRAAYIFWGMAHS